MPTTNLSLSLLQKGFMLPAGLIRSFLYRIDWCVQNVINEHTHGTHYWVNTHIIHEVRHIIREVRRLQNIKGCRTALCNRNITGRVRSYITALKQKGVPSVVVQMKLGRELSLLNPTDPCETLNDISCNPEHVAFYHAHIVPILRHLFNCIMITRLPGLPITTGVMGATNFCLVPFQSSVIA